MSSPHRQPPSWQLILISSICCLALLNPTPGPAAERSVLPVPNADAKAEADMKEYTELVEHTDAKIELVPIKGGEFLMGSSKDEEGRDEGEGPQHKVKVDAFWMGKHEIQWDAFEVWMSDLDIQIRKMDNVAANDRDKAADEYQISQPTAPYSDPSQGMGREKRPAVCMTHFAAKIFCKWLTEKTGRYYRLPTEAEWEYACRAGTTSAYSFGDDASAIEDFAWYFDNCEKYHMIGQKKPNAWGLYDMHGNVAEWVLDGYTTDFYGKSASKTAVNPLSNPTTWFPTVVRGGSWMDDPEALRSAARGKSSSAFHATDPQIPKSIWYHPDAVHVGFRIIRPLVEPTPEEEKEKWDKAEPFFDRKQGR